MKSINDNVYLDENQKRTLVDEVNNSNKDNFAKILNKLSMIDNINKLSYLKDNETTDFENNVISNNNASENNESLNNILNRAKLQNDKNKAIENIDQLTNLSQNLKNEFHTLVNSSTTLDLNSSSTAISPNGYYIKAQELDNSYKALNEKIVSIPETIKNKTDELYIYASREIKEAFDSAYTNAVNLNQNQVSDKVSIDFAIQDLNNKLENLRTSARENKAIIENVSFTNFSTEKTNDIKNQAKSLLDKETINTYLAKATELDNLISNANTKYLNLKNNIDAFNVELKTILQDVFNSANSTLNEYKTKIDNAIASNNITLEDFQSLKGQIDAAEQIIANNKLADKFSSNKIALANQLLNNLPVKKYDEEELRSKYLNILINSDNMDSYSAIETQALNEYKNNIKDELSKSIYLNSNSHTFISEIDSITSLTELKAKNSEIETQLVDSLNSQISKSNLETKDLFTAKVNEINNKKNNSSTGIIKELNNEFTNLATQAKEKIKNSIDSNIKLSDDEKNLLNHSLEIANLIDDINEVQSLLDSKVSLKETIVTRINEYNENIEQNKKDQLLTELYNTNSNDLSVITHKLDTIDKILLLSYLNSTEKNEFINNIIEKNLQDDIDSILNLAKLKDSKNKAIADINQLKNLSSEQKQSFNTLVNESNSLEINSPITYYNQALMLDNSYKSLSDKINSIPEGVKNKTDNIYTYASAETKSEFDTALNNALMLENTKNDNDYSNVISVVNDLEIKFNNLKASAESIETIIDHKNFNNFSSSKSDAIKEYTRSLSNNSGDVHGFLNKADELDDLIPVITQLYAEAKNALDLYKNDNIVFNELETELENASGILKNLKNDIENAKNNYDDLSLDLINHQKNALNIENLNTILNKFASNKLELTKKIINNLPLKSYAGALLRIKYINELINTDKTNSYENLETRAIEEYRSNINNEIMKITHLNDQITSFTSRISTANSLISLKEANN
ncbi:UNVERIFIED_CONTAM: hypothetical protein O8I53_09195 [Campylobacter lari]